MTGESSRLNAEHLIFSSIRSAQHILTKNNDAYTFIDDIFQQCMRKKRRGYVFKLPWDQLELHWPPDCINMVY